MLKEIIDRITIEEIHKRLADSPLHTLHAQFVSDVKSLRELGKDIPVCTKIIDDLSKPAVYRTNMKLVYAGMVCILNLLLEKESLNINSDPIGDD